jgi:signal transduction histidine kinase
MLNQALTNLILNAIQASPENEEIEISLKENEASITIHIKDKGVSKDLNDKIFEPFYTTKANGTGLGLSISKNIINAHNGSIKFESKDTETIFIVSFIKTQEI